MALEFRHLFRSVSNSFDWHTRQEQCVNWLRWIIQTESKHNKAYKIYKNWRFYKSLISLTSNVKNWTGTNFLWSKNVNIKLIDIKRNKSKSLLPFLLARIWNETPSLCWITNIPKDSFLRYARLCLQKFLLVKTDGSIFRFSPHFLRQL